MILNINLRSPRNTFGKQSVFQLLIYYGYLYIFLENIDFQSCEDVLYCLLYSILLSANYVFHINTNNLINLLRHLLTKAFVARACFSIIYFSVHLFLPLSWYFLIFIPFFSCHSSSKSYTCQPPSALFHLFIGWHPCLKSAHKSWFIVVAWLIFCHPPTLHALCDWLFVGL